MARSVTTLSTKGQVILPKVIRDKKQWSAGTRLIVEKHAERRSAARRSVGSRDASRRMCSAC